jgi:amidohydrolase
MLMTGRQTVAHSLTPSYIAQLAEQLRSELTDLRRFFHQYPELSWEETHTAQVIAAHLEPLGLRVQKDVGGYGLIAQLTGAMPGPMIAYRAEMDALPVQDNLQTAYRSTALGIKHACGHDAHMTIAIGVAKILSALRGELHGTIRFLFQPAEEALDGAQAMIASGALSEPSPQAILAFHAFPMPVGTVGLTPGRCLAGMEEFQVKFNAPSTMLPALIKTTLPALEALSNQLPPETAEAFDALLQRMATGDVVENGIYLSCWQNIGGSAGSAHVTGLVSMVDDAARHDIRRRIRQTLDSVVDELGATYDLWASFENPSVINDATLTRQLRPLVEAVVGKDNVLWFNAPYPFAHEDFALYAQQVPASLLWLGTANHDLGIQSLLHTADYDIDEDALVIGTTVVSYLLLHLWDHLPA